MISEKIKEIEEYILSFDYTKLSIQELDIYIKILISVENKKFFETFMPSLTNGNTYEQMFDFLKNKEE